MAADTGTTETVPTTPGTAAETSTGAAQGAVTQAADVAEGAGVAQTETYTKKQVDGMMAQVRRAVQQEIATKAEQDKLAEQGKWQEVAAKKDQALQQAMADNRALALKYAVALEAGKLGISKPDIALRLLDQSRVEYNDAGEPTNLAALLKVVLDDVPGLASTAAGQENGVVAGTGAVVPTGQQHTNGARKTTLTLDTIKTMTPAQVNANWDEVQKVLASQGGGGVKI